MSTRSVEHFGLDSDAIDGRSVRARTSGKPQGASGAIMMGMNAPVVKNELHTVRQFCISVAGKFTLHGVKAAFNQCERQSALLHQELRRCGVDAHRRGGNFEPTTAYETWHPRWQKLGGDFIHYWVLVGDMILDPTAAQFGEADLTIATKGDLRYFEHAFGAADFRSTDEPLNIKRVEGSICSLHGLDEIATPVSHIVTAEKSYRVCAACAETLAFTGAKVKAMRNPGGA